MQSHYEQILDAGAEVVAVSTDNLRGAESSVAMFEADFPILYTARDPAVPESYGVFNLFSDGLASASIFIVTEGNQVAWNSIGENYMHQVDGEEILRQLEAL